MLDGHWATHCRHETTQAGKSSEGICTYGEDAKGVKDEAG